jgi:PTS system nitrogen regulatory IIA component
MVRLLEGMTVQGEATRAERRSGMRMTDFVIREAIIPELTATTKDGVIREMVGALGSAGYFKGAETEDIVKAVLKRELLGSTGIGRGVAIPHTKHNGVERLIGSVAISRPGVAFDSLDGEPVHVFVLLISPQDRPGDHLRALENVSRSLRDDGFVRSLRQATTREAIWDLLGELDH